MAGPSIDTSKVLADWLKRVKKPLICELCGGTRWTGGSLITIHVTPTGTQIGALVVGGPYLPLVELGCQVCGNTKLLNLVLLGYMPPLTQGTMPGDRLIQEALGGENGPLS